MMKVQSALSPVIEITWILAIKMDLKVRSKSEREQKGAEEVTKEHDHTHVLTLLFSCENA